MNKKDVLNYIDEMENDIKDIAFKIWSNPEISEHEKQSKKLIKEKLVEHGFSIVDLDSVNHGFYAEYGEGSPVIAILGEYDALPGLSQNIDTKFNPKEVNGPGHGCGHNLLGTASLGSALALKNYIEKTNIKGTIRYYGCPEEETLAGKVKMVKAGDFDGCDIALSWHPMNANLAAKKAYLANNSLKFKFHGTSAHAAQSPEAGRSALDAVELMNVGANYLREHVIDKARIHYTITNAGGTPNIVPKEAESWYYIRAPHRKDVEEITERLIKIAEGAATMTETTVEVDIVSGCYEMLPNDVLFNISYKNMIEIERPKYTEEELQFAKDIQKTLNPKTIQNEIKKFIPNAMDEEIYMHEGVVDKDVIESISLTGSSDSGDISWIMPMNLIITAAWPLGVAAHSWQATSASGSSLGMKGMLYAAKVFTGIGYDLLNNKDLVKKAIDEFNERTKNQKYISPLKDI